MISMRCSIQTQTIYLCQSGNTLINNEWCYNRYDWGFYRKPTPCVQHYNWLSAIWLCGIFFLYDYSEIGKIFILSTLYAAIRSKMDIVSNVVSSGIFSWLLPGGRTVNSLFSIPINPNENSMCNIKQGSHWLNYLLDASS